MLSWAGDIKKQHDEFRATMDKLMGAANSGMSEPPGLRSKYPPMPRSFQEQEMEFEVVKEPSAY